MIRPTINRALSRLSVERKAAEANVRTHSVFPVNLADDTAIVFSSRDDIAEPSRLRIEKIMRDSALSAIDIIIAGRQ